MFKINTSNKGGRRTTHDGRQRRFTKTLCAHVRYKPSQCYLSVLSHVKWFHDKNRQTLGDGFNLKWQLYKTLCCL